MERMRAGAAPAGSNVTSPVRLRRTASPADGGLAVEGPTTAAQILWLQATAGNRANKGLIQARRAVRAGDDPWERAADRAAARVAHGGEGARAEALSAGTVRPGQTTDLGRAAGSRPSADSAPLVGRRGGVVDGAVEDGLAGAGQGCPLPDGVRVGMERAYGTPLEGVRVHDDARADHLAASVAADAFTAGNDVYFRSGKYQPANGAGRELLAHEVAHVVQQQASGAEPASAPIGRKIGFEFEFPNWQTAESTSSNFATATTPPIMPATMTNVWKRIAKGKALVRGPGFELQADDDPGGGARSDLEIVTDPFDESPAGRGQLRTAMNEVHATLQDVTANFNGWWAAHHLPRAIDLRGTARRPYSFIYPAGGPAFRAKPQATIGLRLEKVADLLEDMFPVGARVGATGVAGEGAVTTAARRQGRQELTGWDSSGGPGPGQILQVQGQAPGQARQAIAAYRGIPANNAAPAATAGLTGLLSLVIAYLRMADQSLVRSYAKTIAPLMARTDFAALFGLLSPAERTWYKANGGQPFFDLVQQAPWLNGMNAADEVYSQGIQSPSHGVGQAQGLTRGKWLKGIPKGTDYLSGKKFPDKAQRGDIEGLGSYGKKTDKVDLGGGQTAKAAILELRAMPQTDLANLPAITDRLFLYSYLANRGGAEKYGEVNVPF